MLAMTDVPQKFEYKSISSAFVTPTTAAQTTSTSTSTPSTTSTSPTTETPEQRSARLIQDLKRVSARAKRFGTDATEIDKLILRAEKFGTDPVTVKNTIAALDKPLVERNNTTRGARGQRGAPYERPNNVKETAPVVPDEEKEKMKKRQARFASK
ncbi:uncharacterized protein V1513DRAFT_446494 [Lipomyces chichibuensis]|uniref:uncharacterized protein n=1 Tax=Lipomyces chichibuensis TaxID=1546026 RepID=UPI003343292E